MSKNKKSREVEEGAAEAGYDASLIRVPKNIKPRYSGTDHVEYGRPSDDLTDDDNIEP